MHLIGLEVPARRGQQRLFQDRAHVLVRDGCGVEIADSAAARVQGAECRPPIIPADRNVAVDAIAEDNVSNR